MKPTSFMASAIMLLVLPFYAQAQGRISPIPENPSTAPQIELDGTGIATLAFQNRKSTSGSATQFDFSDSSLMLGISQRLLKSGAVGSFVAGVTTTDQTESSSATSLLLSQLYLDYQNRSMDAYLGRNGVQTKLFDFPTLRGSDLNEFVNVLDPFSNGVITDESRYSDTAGIQWNHKLHYFMDLHLQHLLTTAAPYAGQTGINSYGVTLKYEAAPELTAISKVPFWGAGYERQTIGTAQGGASNILYGGIIYNIVPSPINRLDLRLQDIYSFSNGLSSISSVPDTFRAASNSVAASLRFLHQVQGMPGYEIALTGGYRSYNNFTHANTYALALTGTKRLGVGFDLITQYTFQHRESLYASALGVPKDESRIELGFVFNFENTFNPHIGPRRTLQNLQHQYIPE